MISYTNKFVFVHVYKVAGTSVKYALSQSDGKPGIYQRLFNKVSRLISGKSQSPVAEQPLHGHATAQEYKDLLSDDWEKFYSFAFVRNPYDWQVSLYEYARQTPHHYQHELHRAMSFDEYVRWRCSDEYRLQKDFVCDDSGECLVDFVGRFEQLDIDFRRIVESLGLKAELPHRNRSTRSKARDYYNSETQKLVADTFDQDFQFFGYSKEIPY